MALEWTLKDSKVEIDETIKTSGYMADEDVQKTSQEKRDPLYVQ